MCYSSIIPLNAQHNPTSPQTVAPPPLSNSTNENSQLPTTQNIPQTTDTTNTPSTTSTTNTTNTAPVTPNNSFTNCQNQERCIQELIQSENRLGDLLEILRLFDDIETQSEENNCLTSRPVDRSLHIFIGTSVPEETGNLEKTGNLEGTNNQEGTDNQESQLLQLSVDFGTNQGAFTVNSNQNILTPFSGTLGSADLQTTVGWKHTALSRILIKSQEAVHITKIGLSLEINNDPLIIFEDTNNSTGWDIGPGNDIYISKKEFFKNEAWKKAKETACNN